MSKLSLFSAVLTLAVAAGIGIFQPQEAGYEPGRNIEYLSERGHVIPSLFFGADQKLFEGLSEAEIAAWTKWRHRASERARLLKMNRSNCGLASIVSGPTSRFLELFNVQVVEAVFCDDGWCGGHYMELNPTPPLCGTDCGGGTWDQYISIALGGYYWSGYRFNGSTSCEGCRCRELGCFNLG